MECRKTFEDQCHGVQEETVYGSQICVLISTQRDLKRTAVIGSNAKTIPR